jgi:hypothetical protein
MTLRGGNDQTLGDQLLQVARDPDLRQSVYEHLREYCHQCRNRLNSLKLSIYLAMKQSPTPTDDRWVEIDRHYQDLEKRVEQIQFLCRPIALCQVTLGLDLLVEDRRVVWEALMAEQGRELELVPPAERAVASFDVESLGKALDALVAWRAADRSAAGLARLRWWVDAGTAHLAWEESAEIGRPPGLPASDEAPPWTLPILARIVEAHGGDYKIQHERGWRLEFAWPSRPITPRA